MVNACIMKRAMGQPAGRGYSGRRLFLLSPLTLIATPFPQAEATRPPSSAPPSLRELVQRADAICVATAYRYAYRSVDLLRLSEENGRDFDETPDRLKRVHRPLCLPRRLPHVPR